ncbi:regulatory protein RecX [Thiohalobacter sp. IOR34]|uniref:regulatory protein RecX n=1 Tax=Thiohalobacter sp. IOR34 TaxID=3057176 RepID=UPI0025AF0C17|nr:regulatory protein RecX [Thiohalobacter sp. IOR34]WJW74736.1 regulatory protein RecX [Thiohalobacter sp. IOR34]
MQAASESADDEELRRAARETALGLLARREHSRLELGRKLAQRGYPAALVEGVLDALGAEGLQSDSRFAESYVYSRSGRGFGPQRIRAELRERGIDDGLIEASLADAGVDWARLAAEAWHKRFAGRPPADYRERARQQRFMLNRGFTHEQIQAVFRNE